MIDLWLRLALAFLPGGIPFAIFIYLICVRQDATQAEDTNQAQKP